MSRSDGTMDVGVLKFPLRKTQIDAAQRVHNRLEQWRVTDSALLRLRAAMPDFDYESCLLKTVAVNTLYGTQILAVTKMAKHVHDVLNTMEYAKAGPELVHYLAALPAIDGKTRKFVSFAAKFCHFFIDETRFPIFDDAAKFMLQYHLGFEAYGKDQTQ